MQIGIFQKNIDKHITPVLYFFHSNSHERNFRRMLLYEELYFEIEVTGQKSQLKKFVNFLRSGDLDEFFEFSSEYINYADDYAAAEDTKETSLVLSTDDYGIEIDEFDTDEFLEILCKASKSLYVSGHLYDVDDEEYSFISEAGDSYYVNAKNAKRFNEDEDKPTESDEDEEEEQ